MPDTGTAVWTVYRDHAVAAEDRRDARTAHLFWHKALAAALAVGESDDVTMGLARRAYAYSL